jgi:hypothetical protein
VPTDYLQLFSWLFVAVGVALLGGTGMALLHYRRHGSFPGQPVTGKDGAPVRVSPRTAIVKCLLGAALVLWGVLSLTLRVG